MTNEELIKLANRNNNISDEEIYGDILDTKKEIREYESKIGNYNGRFDVTYNEEIKQREEFIEKLENIIKGRNLINQS